MVEERVLSGRLWRSAWNSFPRGKRVCKRSCCKHCFSVFDSLRLLFTRRKACSHESSWNHRGAVVGRRGTVVGNITSPTMLPRHFHDTSTTGSCWCRGVCAHCLPCSIGGSHNGSYRGSIVEASWTTTILYKICFNRSSMLHCFGMDGHHYLQ